MLKVDTMALQLLLLCVFLKSIGNRMNANALKDLHYSRYLKILSKLHEPLGWFASEIKIATIQ